MTRRTWGGLRKRGKSWRIYYRDPEGRQVEEGAGTDRREAAALLAERKRQIEGGEWKPPSDRVAPAVLTLGAYLAGWLDARERRRVVKVRDERRLFAEHVLPTLGGKALADVRRSHVVEMMRAVSSATSSRTGRPLAPRTVLHVYRTLATAFRDAVLDGILDASPCSLSTRRRELPVKRDVSPTWRTEAVWTREEAAQLISDERIPDDRRVYYALGLLAGLRSSEIAGRRWSDIDTSTKPLARLLVATQARRDLSGDTATKTGDVREVPIHPTLAAILAEWRLGGFAHLYGRVPRAGDYIVPSRSDSTKPRSKKSLERMKEDAEALGLREVPSPRHAMRATFISLLELDGARASLTRRVTHAPPTDVAGGYLRPRWEDLCAEVGKLRLERVRQLPLDTLLDRKGKR